MEEITEGDFKGDEAEKVGSFTLVRETRYVACRGSLKA